MSFTKDLLKWRVMARYLFSNFSSIQFLLNCELFDVYFLKLTLDIFFNHLYH